MSLITEALQLRSTNPRGRGSGGESFPPLRRTPTAAKAILVIAGLCAVGVLVVWKGVWALETIENLAGIRLGPSSSGPRPMAVPPPVAAAKLTESAPTPLALSEKPAAPAVVAAQVEPPPKTASEPKAAPLPEELQPMDVNLSLALIEDEKARQQLDEENQKKIEGFLRKMDVQGVCHQGADSTALLDAVLVRKGDAVGEFGLTLKIIEPRRLIFADRNGREYTKSY